MSTASIKKIISCKKNQIIEMVLDIEQYPKFVPWCLEGKILDKNDSEDFTEIKADLRSFITSIISSFCSPKPTIIPDLVKIFLLNCLAFFNSSNEEKYRAPGLTVL